MKKASSQDKTDDSRSKEMKIGDYIIDLVWHDYDAESIVLKNIIEGVLESLGEELSMHLKAETGETIPKKNLVVICCSHSNFNRYTDGKYENKLKNVPYTTMNVPHSTYDPGIFVLLQDEYDHRKDGISLGAFAYTIASIFIQAVYKSVFPSRKEDDEKFADGFGTSLMDFVVQNISYETVYDEEYDSAFNSKN